jgi:hypothetical protein
MVTSCQVAHFSWDMKHTMSTGWLVHPNQGRSRGHSHVHHSFQSLSYYEYRTHSEIEDSRAY